MAWQVGEKLKDGRYTIEQVLGHGGFGQTYVAVRNHANPNNAERVVLKHLKQEIDEDTKTFRDRQTAFTNEGIRLARCEHSHIVKVYPETFWEGDLVHMVMEHIKGENLAIMLKQRQQTFSLDEALRYIGQIADALNHIHSFKPPLIHRDVKPANIVLRQKSCEVVLVDFGSAKEVHTGATLSMKSIGSGGYSPMEIYTEHSKHTYTDVYSLAATLYFLLTAIHPMSAHERASEKDDHLIPPIEHNSDIPMRVNNAIVAAMERYAEDRVQTVSEFMQRLGQPLKPSIIHQGLGLFGAKVVPSNPQTQQQIGEQAAKIAAAEKQSNLERERRKQAEREAQEIKKQLQELEAEKQRLVREQRKAEAERHQRQWEAQIAREQLQKSDAEKQRLANKLQRANAEKERQAQAVRGAQVKADKERQVARGVQIKAEQAKREQAEREAKAQKKQKIELRSAKGIDYRELEKLLKNQKWRKADELTSKLMCRVANREKEGRLVTEDIEAFPCEDLRTIDQLWVHYSNSKFGFSIQEKLWLECGGDISKYDYKVWKKFQVKVGWHHPERDDWRTYTEFMNITENAQHALLASLPSSGVFWGWRWWVRGCVVWDCVCAGEVIPSLAQRFVDCKGRTGK